MNANPHALAAAAVAIAVALAATVRALDPAPGSQARAEMARIETELAFHGVDVAGFAMSEGVDLAVVDALAPPGCARVMRAAWLARLAVLRMAPALGPQADAIAAGAAAAAAHDIGRLDCLPETTP